MKKELLSPAGNMESLKMAVYHGADAVYLGGKKFGARAFASNFSESEMLSAIFFCHLYGVKIYVTVNTMIYESELDEVLSYIEFLYLNHVDAVIMADIGLMKLCHEKYPDLEIHASTQVHIHNISQIEFLRKLGVKRVVLARELSLEEIKRFPDDIEIEVFIHGALCISYSGQCLFSSLLMNRSGNRGECAQICRLPWKLLKNNVPYKTNGEFLLSTRDLNTSSRFSELLDSNIQSFKIEGRMKSPAYVGFMTQTYRSLIDRYFLKESMEVSEEDIKKAETLFGRGFTSGKIFHAQDDEFMNQKTSNHQGSFLGSIEVIDKKKIGIRLDDDLNQEDGIRFVEENKGMIVNFLYHKNGDLISGAKNGDLIFVDNKVGISHFGSVMKTLDKKLEESILARSEKKVLVTMKVFISLNHIEFQMSDGVFSVIIKEDCVEKSDHCPITKEVVKKQFSKLGNTPFLLQNIEISLEDNLYMNVRDMNEIRRRAVDELIKKRVNRSEVAIRKAHEEEYSYDDSICITANAMSEEHVKTLLELGVSKIYVSDYKLAQRYEKNVIYRTNRVMHSTYYDSKKVLACESGALLDKEEAYLDYFLNISNHATEKFWTSCGVKQMCLTPEITDYELGELLKKYPNGNPFELIVYGRLEVMVLNHCLLHMNVNKEKVCKVCKGKDFYSLKDRNGKIYPLHMDEFHRTHIMHYKRLNLLQKIETYFHMGIRKFRLEFYDESAEEIKKIVTELKKSLHV